MLVGEHFPDAFALARKLEQPARVIDVGSGGGLPAIPLALLRPRLAITLVEPIAKKAAFLRTAIRELGLGDRVSVHVGRGEAVAKETPRAFDVGDLAGDAGARQVAGPGGEAGPSGWPGVRAGRRRRPARGSPTAEIYFDGRRALIEVVCHVKLFHVEHSRFGVKLFHVKHRRRV